ncbi:helix-turn-helix domain-containing protein [Nonomuraea sp. NPDC005650]|uniref:AfsR/SARP family transcriptional regulator n=1 Tax=Nonomuraea sp. NPDC005650 TaxID=3157045 RepID=UPI0033B40040
MVRPAGTDEVDRSSEVHQPNGMEFRLLRPVGFWVGDDFLGPTTPQQRSVLAMLRLNLGQTVPLDRLMRAVWEQEPPISARNAIQGYVSRLRRLLARQPETELPISPPRPAVPPPARVDLSRFRELVARAHASDPAQASDLF